MTALAHSLYALHAPALREWKRLLGKELYDRYIREQGEVILSDTPPSGSAVVLEQRLIAQFGLEVDALSPAEIRRLYPQISDVVKFGILKKGNGHTVSPAGLNSALAETILADGGQFYRESVLKLIPESGQWLILTSTGNHRASDIVVAGGVWSAQLLAPLGIKIPLESQREYHVMIKNSGLEIGLPFIHRGRGIGFTPMLEGLRVAGTVEFSGVDGMPNERRADQAMFHARQLFPPLTQSPHSNWTGQRPSTPDSLPVIGGMADMPGLWLCFGHGTYGMTAAPPSGRLIAELMVGGRTFIDPTPYSPNRFK